MFFNEILHLYVQQSVARWVLSTIIYLASISELTCKEVYEKKVNVDSRE